MKDIGVSRGGGSKAEKEYVEFFEQSLGPITTTLGLLLGFFMLGDAELGAELGFTSEEVEALAGPLARILAKQNISAKTRKLITSSGDYVAVAGVMGLYAARIFDLMRERATSNVTARKTESPAAASSQNGYRDNGYTAPELLRTVPFSGAYNSD